ncbi:MAG: hypothetical protein K2X86_04655, partial [Cytophagaceae bacterium]|nr:hypothetical protein [Cytophagaceae bacterium]
KREIKTEYLPIVYPDKEITFDDGSRVHIWFDHGVMKGEFTYKPSNVKPVPKIPWYQSFHFWYILIIFILFFIIFLQTLYQKK